MSVRPSFISDSGLEMIAFGGKGGVGKTTLACAAAAEIARRDPSRPVRLLSTDPAHSVADAWRGAAVPANLEIVEVDSDGLHEVFMEEARSHLHQIASRGTFLEDADIEPFLDLSLPGVDELMAFFQLSRWLEEGFEGTVVIDTAPTGHALRLLSMPELLDGWMEAVDALLAKHRYMADLFGGREDATETFVEALAESFSELAELWTDEDRFRFVPVFNAEALSVAETARLIEDLGEHGVPVEEAVVNRVVTDVAAGLGDLAESQVRVLGDLPEAFGGLRVWGVGLVPGGVNQDVGRLFDSVLEPEAVTAQMSAAASGAGRGVGPGSTAVLQNLPAGALDTGTKLLVVTGKGGVGKTTVSCSVGLACAARGERVLLVSTDPAGSLGDAFGVEIEREPAELTRGLFVCQLDAEAEFEALKEEYQTELEELLDNLTGGVSLAFEGEALERLLDLAPPGLDEVMAVATIPGLMQRGKYDRVILDTAPTGHTLRLLELPTLVQAWLSNLFRLFVKYEGTLNLPRVQDKLLEISRGVKRFSGMLEPGGGAAVLPVTIATAMGVDETEDLVAACRAKGLGLPALVVNQLTPDRHTPATDAMRESERGQLARLEALGLAAAWIERGGDPRGAAALSALGAGLLGDPAAAREAA